MYALTLSFHYFILATVLILLILFIIPPVKRKKKSRNYVPGDDVTNWTILESELLRNLNGYRAKNDKIDFDIDREIHSFAKYCAKRAATDNNFMKNGLPLEIVDTMDSFPFNQFSIMFHQADGSVNMSKVGKALKCKEEYRKALLNKSFKYIGIGADVDVGEKYYYCVILAE